MIDAPHPLIAAALAAPKTHRVVVAYADGRVKTHEARGLKAAQNHAGLYRARIGLDLIDRDTRGVVRVASVTVEEIDAERVKHLLPATAIVGARS